mgnify:CR=1 FL=1|tara:strand:+ start:175 stop:1425 length:1251 start_codon:yes stop_codon:yes gene_type:complete
MIDIILIILLIFVFYKIYCLVNNKNEPFINITNPFVDGLSQFQLGKNLAPDESILNNFDLPNLETNPANNVLNKNLNNEKINKINKLSKLNKLNNDNKLQKDINIINELRNKKQQKNLLPCKKLNKFFVQTQFNDAYRDVLTAFNDICPDQKQIFNLQSLPVTTTYYDLNKKTPPFIFIKLITQFINSLNKNIKKLPESVEIVNDYNNYLPLTSQLEKYVANKGINKFYKEIGVDYNLYADTPPNSPVELIKIISVRREFTDAETKYIATFVVKKILKSVSDQIQITVNFVTKNDPLEGYDLFNGQPESQNINTSKQVVIEFIFIDGFYTNDFNVDYDCLESPGDKTVSQIGSNSEYMSYYDLGKDNMLNEYEIAKRFNKINREHELEMNNFNINVPYPVYESKYDALKNEFSDMK